MPPPPYSPAPSPSPPPCNALPTELPLPVCPAAADLLFHLPSETGADVHLAFNQLGKALAAAAGIPSALFLHSFLICNRSSYFRAALVAFEPPAPGSPAHIVYKFPMGASEIDVCALYHVVRAMYTLRFEELVAATPLNHSASAWFDALDRICTALGWEHGMQQILLLNPEAPAISVSAGSPIAATFSASSCAPLGRRRTNTPPPLHLLPESPLTPLFSSTANEFPQFSPLTLSAGIVIAVPRPRRLSQLLAEELDSPPPSPLARVPTAIREAELARKEEEFGNVGDLGMIRRSSPNLERRGSAGSLAQLQPSKDVMAILEKINASSASSVVKSPSPAALQPLAALVGHASQQGMERRGSWNGNDAPRRGSLNVIPEVSSPPGNITAIPESKGRSRGRSISSGSQALPSPVPPPVFVSPASPTAVLPSIASSASDAVVSNHRVRERRNSYQPPRPSASILAQCATPPADPLAAKRRQLASWITRFENMALEPGLHDLASSREGWHEVVDGIIGASSRRESLAEVQDVEVSRHFPATESETDLRLTSSPSPEVLTRTGDCVQRIEQGESGDILVTTTTTTTTVVKVTTVERRHGVQHDDDVLRASPSGIIVINEDSSASSANGSASSSPDNSGDETASKVAERRRAQPVPINAVSNVAGFATGTLVGSIPAPPRLQRQRRSSAPVIPANVPTTSPREAPAIGAAHLAARPEAAPRPRSPLSAARLATSKSINAGGSAAPATPATASAQRRRPQTLGGLAAHLVDLINQLLVVPSSSLPSSDAITYLLRVLDALYVDAARRAGRPSDSEASSDLAEVEVVVSFSESLERSVVKLLSLPEMRPEELLRVGRLLGCALPAVTGQPMSIKRVKWECPAAKHVVQERLVTSGWAALVVS